MKLLNSAGIPFDAEPSGLAAALAAGGASRIGGGVSRVARDPGLVNDGGGALGGGAGALMGGGAEGDAGRSGSPASAPQLGQNLAPDAIVAPQRGQVAIGDSSS